MSLYTSQLKYQMRLLLEGFSEEVLGDYFAVNTTQFKSKRRFPLPWSVTKQQDRWVIKSLPLTLPADNHHILPPFLPLKQRKTEKVIVCGWYICLPPSSWHYLGRMDFPSVSELPVTVTRLHIMSMQRNGHESVKSLEPELRVNMRWSQGDSLSSPTHHHAKYLTPAPETCQRLIFVCISKNIFMTSRPSLHPFSPFLCVF